MSASSQEHHKLDHIMSNLDQQIRPASAEDKQQMHTVLDMFTEYMQNEDPNEPIYCNCHGELWRNQDVDVWGNCPWTRGED